MTAAAPFPTKSQSSKSQHTQFVTITQIITNISTYLRLHFHTENYKNLTRAKIQRKLQQVPSMEMVLSQCQPWQQFMILQGIFVLMLMIIYMKSDVFANHRQPPCLMLWKDCGTHTLALLLPFLQLQ